MTELKPCPFCGEWACIVDGPVKDKYGVTCSKCDCWMDTRGTEDEAIAAWNTRAQSAPAQGLPAWHPGTRPPTPADTEGWLSEEVIVALRPKDGEVFSHGLVGLHPDKVDALCRMALWAARTAKKGEGE